MWIYASLLLLPAAWAAAGRFSPAHARTAAIAIGTVLTIFIGLRYQVGGDWHAYWLMYERAQSHAPGTALAISDPAYMALNMLAGRLGLSVAFVNLACAALFSWGVVTFAARQARPWLSLLIAIPVLVVMVAMTTTRQSAAIGLELVALKIYLDGGRRAPPALLLIACAFHWSAAVLLPLIPLLLASGRRRNVLLAGLAVLGAAAAAGVWIAAQKGDAPNPAFGAIFRLLPSLIAVAVLAILHRKKRLSESEGIAAIYLAGIVLLCLAIWPASSLAADRLGHYTVALQMLVLPRAASEAPTPLPRRMALTGIVALYLILLAGWALRGSYTKCMLPYRSYLQQPHMLLASWRLEPVCIA